MTRDERGSAALEFVIIVPVLLLLVATMVGGARLTHARAVVAGAADSAARAASLAREPIRAEAAARAIIASDTADLPCMGGAMASVDTTGFAVPVGRPAHVRVMVTCELSMVDEIPLLPWALDVEAESKSVLDRYRGRP